MWSSSNLHGFQSSLHMFLLTKCQTGVPTTCPTCLPGKCPAIHDDSPLFLLITRWTRHCVQRDYLSNRCNHCTGLITKVNLVLLLSCIYVAIWKSNIARKPQKDIFLKERPQNAHQIKTIAKWSSSLQQHFIFFKKKQEQNSICKSIREMRMRTKSKMGQQHVNWGKPLASKRTRVLSTVSS